MANCWMCDLWEFFDDPFYLFPSKKYKSRHVCNHGHGRYEHDDVTRRYANSTMASSSTASNRDINHVERHLTENVEINNNVDIFDRRSRSTETRGRRNRLLAKLRGRGRARSEVRRRPDDVSQQLTLAQRSRSAMRHQGRNEHDSSLMRHHRRSENESSAARHQRRSDNESSAVRHQRRLENESSAVRYQTRSDNESSALRHQRRHENGSSTLIYYRGHENGNSTLPYQRRHDNGNSTLPHQRVHENGNSTLPHQRRHENGNSTLPHQRRHENGITPIPRQRGHENGHSTLPHQRRHEIGISPMPRQRIPENGSNPMPRKDRSRSNSGSSFKSKNSKKSPKNKVPTATKKKKKPSLSRDYDHNNHHNDDHNDDYKDDHNDDYSSIFSTPRTDPSDDVDGGRDGVATPSRSSVSNVRTEIESDIDSDSDKTVDEDLDTLFIRSEDGINVDEYLTQAKKNFESNWNPLTDGQSSSNNPVRSLDDFHLERTIGTGSFGRVFLAKPKYRNTTNGSTPNGSPYNAIKALDKQQIVKLKQVEHTLNEKKILQCISHQFLVKLECSFKDNCYLFIVLDFIAGGRCLAFSEKWVNSGAALKPYIRFIIRVDCSEDHARFYAAQIVLAFEYLHNLDIVYRDLKPENILINNDGYLKITDFGFAKYINGRTWTLCGTPEYLAPEIILNKGYNKSVDWWAFGILLFEMVAGVTPFYAEQPIQIYEKVCAGKVPRHKEFSAALSSLVSHLLEIDLTKRFGNLRRGVIDIKTHEWFKTTDWVAIYSKKVPVPYVPDMSAANFDDYPDEPMRTAVSVEYATEFEDF